MRKCYLYLPYLLPFIALGLDTHFHTLSAAAAATRALSAVLGCNLKNHRMISVRFQGKPFSNTVIQVYAPASNAEEAELNGSMKTYKAYTIF